jgi:hypothetical protein
MHCESRVAVAVNSSETQEEERPPLEAGTRGLVKGVSACYTELQTECVDFR